MIDRDGVIVIGHCRALAAKKLGMEEVPKDGGSTPTSLLQNAVLCNQRKEG